MFTKTLVQKCHTLGRTPFPPIARNLVPRKNLVRKICVSWTVLITQLMRKTMVVETVLCGLGKN